MLYKEEDDGKDNTWLGEPHTGRGWEIFRRGVQIPRLQDVPLQGRCAVRDFDEVEKKVSHFLQWWSNRLAGGVVSDPADAAFRAAERKRRAKEWWEGFLERHHRDFPTPLDVDEDGGFPTASLLPTTTPHRTSEETGGVCAPRAGAELGGSRQLEGVVTR